MTDTPSHATSDPTTNAGQRPPRPARLSLTKRLEQWVVLSKVIVVLAAVGSVAFGMMAIGDESANDRTSFWLMVAGLAWSAVTWTGVTFIEWEIARAKLAGKRRGAA
jgi:hypothetical protein